jgi:hypothetical protein
MEHGLRRALVWARPECSSGLGFSSRKSAHYYSAIFKFLVLISLQFKFSLNLNSNLVSILAYLCNPVEYFYNIVMINFMF